MERKLCVITFLSISYAIKFELIMKGLNKDIKLIPVPRSISDSCGLCGKFECIMKDEIKNICIENNIKYEGIYEIN